ncbi:LysE family translocator [Streptomyces collinus]|uniref:LysE family translocator n=1 Tax=Streptomyces collinus TaxID=42684 RepID=UPI00369637FE
MSLIFLATSLVIVATPGTGALFTIAAGLSRGTRASLVASFACTLGVVPHLLAAVTGLAALLHASSVAFETIKFLGVAYLLYMAWAAWRDEGVLVVEKKASPVPVWSVIRTGTVINLLNPKLTIFFFAFLPQFVPADDAGSLAKMLYLGLVFMAMTFVVFAIYGVFAAAVRRHIITRPQVVARMRQIFAISFIALSAKLATTAR